MFSISFYLPKYCFLINLFMPGFLHVTSHLTYDSIENIFGINHELEYFLEGELLFTFYNISTIIHHVFSINCLCYRDIIQNSLTCLGTTGMNWLS